MILENRRQGHIGLATNDLEKDREWYISLGFRETGSFLTPAGEKVCFLDNGYTVYEMYQPCRPVAGSGAGKIDHLSFVSHDIEADYKTALEQGYQICTNGIEQIETFWKKGIRYFKLESPTGEMIEFCQIL